MPLVKVEKDGQQFMVNTNNDTKRPIMDKETFCFLMSNESRLPRLQAETDRKMLENFRADQKAKNERANQQQLKGTTGTSTRSDERAEIIDEIGEVFRKASLKFAKVGKAEIGVLNESGECYTLRAVRKNEQYEVFEDKPPSRLDNVKDILYNVIKDDITGDTVKFNNDFIVRRNETDYDIRITKKNKVINELS